MNKAQLVVRSGKIFIRRSGTFAEPVGDVVAEGHREILEGEWAIGRGPEHGPGLFTIEPLEADDPMTIVLTDGTNSREVQQSMQEPFSTGKVLSIDVVPTFPWAAFAWIECPFPG